MPPALPPQPGHEQEAGQQAQGCPPWSWCQPLAALEKLRPSPSELGRRWHSPEAAPGAVFASRRPLCSFFCLYHFSPPMLRLGRMEDSVAKPSFQAVGKGTLPARWGWGPGAPQVFSKREVPLYLPATPQAQLRVSPWWLGKAPPARDQSSQGAELENNWALQVPIAAPCPAARQSPPDSGYRDTRHQLGTPGPLQAGLATQQDG